MGFQSKQHNLEFFENGTNLNFDHSYPNFFFVLHVIDNWDQAFRLFLLKLSELLEKVIKQRPIRLAWEKPMEGAIEIKRGVRNSGLAKEKQCQAMLRKQLTKKKVIKLLIPKNM